MRRKKAEIKLREQSLSEQILLYLADCVDFSCPYFMQKKLGIVAKDIRGLIKYNNLDFQKGVAELKREKYIKKRKDYDNSVIISLTEKGKLRVLNIKFIQLGRRKDAWDGKWRMVSFDIPEEFRKARDTLRYRMKMGNFRELQKSMFIHPYDCEKEIRNFTKLFKIEKYVKFGVLDYIDGQEGLKVFFNIKNSDNLSS